MGRATRSTFNRECSAAQFLFAQNPYVGVQTHPPLKLGGRGGVRGGGHDSCMTSALDLARERAYTAFYGPFR